MMQEKFGAKAAWAMDWIVGFHEFLPWLPDNQSTVELQFRINSISSYTESRDLC